MLEYFIFDYVNLTHGFIYLTGNYMIAAGVPLLFYDFSQKQTPKSVFMLILRMLLCVVAMEFLASVYFAIFKNDWLVPFVCGAIIDGLYAAFFSKEKPWLNVTRAMAYMATSSLALSITMSMGGLLGEPYYYLQWILITANLIVVFAGIAFIRFVSVPADVAKVPLLFTVSVCLTSIVCFVFALVRRILRVDPATMIAVSIVIMFMYIVVYIMINEIVKKSFADAKKQATELMREADEAALRMGKENLENLRALRHEIKNQYARYEGTSRRRRVRRIEKIFCFLHG